jgi:hypothetical protein
VAGDMAAVPQREREQLRVLVSRRHSPRDVGNQLAAANATAAQRTTSISQECVTGCLLASGKAEVTPHGIRDDVEYMPGFVVRDLEANGVAGLECKVDQQGRVLPPKWVGMTASLVGKRRGDQVVAVLHAIRNVDRPISGPEQSNHQVFWKIADNEPEHYHFSFEKQGQN